MIPLSELAPGVRQTGDCLVFEVQSESRPRLWHRVDLAAYSGFGACSCESFMKSLNARIRRLWPTIPGPRLECPHLFKSRRFLAILVAQEVIRKRVGHQNPIMTRRQWENPGF